MTLQPSRPLKQVLTDLLRQYSITLYPNGFTITGDFFSFYAQLSREGYANLSVEELCETLREIYKEQQIH